jgi:hypothetical protein
MKDNIIKEVGVLFKNLLQNNTLKSLSLSDNFVNSGFEEMKKYFKNNKSMTYFEMKNLNFTDGIDLPFIISENKTLRTIDLEGVQIREIGKVLNSMRHNHSVVKIVFQGNFTFQNS